jgi:hypothetical protein
LYYIIEYFIYILYFPPSLSDTIFPSRNAITLCGYIFTIFASCVAIITVFHLAVNDSKSSIIFFALVGSKFPVGSSHIIISGSCISARAIPVRCISPPDSCSMYVSFLCRSHTCSRMMGTCACIRDWLYPHTSIANATFSATVFLCRSLKSWNTTPSFRRYIRRFLVFLESIDIPVSSTICPESGSTSPMSVRINVVFPDPEEPIRKTNDPDGMSISICSMIGIEPGYQMDRSCICMGE